MGCNIREVYTVFHHVVIVLSHCIALRTEFFGHVFLPYAHW